MIRSSIEKDFAAKKEGYINDSKNPQEPSSLMPWSALKDPRVVRVSRSFGGKDRHSKVRTIRGLRDRRIRLSVQTAVQLYDLQERLGLNQPSKVVDWLLDASQRAIDELPLLQEPIQNYAQYAQPTVASHEETTSQAPPTYLSYMNTDFLKSGGAHSLNLLSGNGDVKSRNDMIIETDETKVSKSMNGNSNEPFRPKSKDVRKETVLFEKGEWMRRNEHENEESIEDHSAQRWIYNSLPKASHSFLTSSLSSAKPYASYYHFEHPSNVPVSHLGIHGSSSHPDDLHNFNATSFQSSLAPQPGSQLLLYQPGTAAAIIPSNIAPQNDLDPKQITSFQMFSSSSQNVQPNSIAASAFQLSIASKHHHSHDHLSRSSASEKG